MNRQYITTFAVFVVLVGVTGAVYQFYFKERLATYAENREKYDKLNQQLKRVGGVFKNTKPDAMVSMWNGAVIPWKDAVEQRSTFYTIKDVYDAEPPPEGTTLRFFYEQESNRLIGQLYQAAMMRNPPCELPAVARAYFGAPTMEQLTGRTVKREEVIAWLQQIRLGCQVIKLLLDSGVYQIHEMSMWPKRTEESLLEMHTTGISFNATAKNVFTFMDKIRLSDHYINHNSLKISNRYLVMQDPVLEVSMLLTQARYIPAPPGKGPAASNAPSRPAATKPAATSTTSSTTEEKSWWQNLWPF